MPLSHSQTLTQQDIIPAAAAAAAAAAEAAATARGSTPRQNSSVFTLASRVKGRCYENNALTRCERETGGHNTCI